MIKRLLTTAILILTISFANAQTAKNSIGISAFTGLKMFTADSVMKGSSWGMEGVYHLNMADNKADWVKMLNIRSVDLSFSYRNYQNIYLAKQPKTTVGFLGDYYGAIAKIGIGIASVGKTELLLNPGFGFGYATESYYTDDNPLVGSHINFTAQIGLKLATPITKSTRLWAGVDLYHYSNAAFKLPNYGVNSINASFGIDQDISTPASQGSKTPFQHYKKHSFEFGVNIGHRGIVQEGGGFDQHPEYKTIQRNRTSDLYKSGIYLGYNYRLNPVLSLRAGFDGVYYYRTLDSQDGIDHFYATYQELGSSYDKLRVGLSLGAELWLGRFSLPVNYGYYLHYKYFTPSYGSTYSPPDTYWTFGARYYFTPHFALEAKQYLHRTQADFAGFGVIVKI
ncbi:MAG: acyloxyacyl hydrolase [Mucilaginibacter sp.]|uniref:acyloxyacyl hydrolase n=1 Tax=Mucilaginibacter sp. TaxID=1882438 RepID=UPI003263F371